MEVLVEAERVTVPGEGEPGMVFFHFDLRRFVI